MNIFIITTEFSRGMKLGNNDENITLSNPNIILKFSTKINTSWGYLAGLHFSPTIPSHDEYLGLIMSPK